MWPCLPLFGPGPWGRQESSACTVDVVRAEFGGQREFHSNEPKKLRSVKLVHMFSSDRYPGRGNGVVNEIRC